MKVKQMLHNHQRPLAPPLPPLPQIAHAQRGWTVAYLVMTMALSSCARSTNRPPSFSQLEDRTLSTNTPAQIQLLASDPDQDFVSFSFTLSPPPPTQTAGRSGLPTLQKVGAYQAVFSWTPGNADAGAYTLSLVVEDEQGARAEESISLSVVDRGVAGGEVVRFIEPTGEVLIYDTREGPCLEASVSLEAASLRSDELSLSLGPDAPAGAMVMSEGEKRYSLSWCPSPEQLSAQAQYPLVLIASNTRGLPNVEKRLLVLIRGQGAEDCPGSPPSVSYEAIMEQRGLANVEVTAYVLDDQGIKSAPTLSYQYVEEGSDWTSVVMEKDPYGVGDIWLGLIPPTSSATDVTVRYFVSVSDDDDPMGTLCDHSTEGPTQEFMWRWAPEERPSYELCEPCQLDLQCGGADDLCVLPLAPDQAGGGLEGVCGQACDQSQLRCPSGFECIQVTSLDGLSAQQCIKPMGCRVACMVDQYDQRGVNNDEQSATPLELGEHANLSICSGDDDWYRVEVEPSHDLRVSLDFLHLTGDIDLELRLEGVTPPRSYLANSSDDGELLDLTTPCEEELTGPLALLIHVIGYNGAQNNYALTVSSTESGAGCTSACSAIADCPVGSYCLAESCVPASCGASACGANLNCLSPFAGMNPSGDAGVCAPECSSDRDCRTGERCKRFDDFRQYCVPEGERRAGEACLSFADCREGMICFPNGGAGGFCAVASCSSGGCQSGTVCADVGIGGSACVVSCAAQSDCEAYSLRCQPVDGAQGCVP